MTYRIMILICISIGPKKNLYVQDPLLLTCSRWEGLYVVATKEFSSFSVNIRFLPGRLEESRPNGANLQYKNERIQVKRATQFNTRNCLRQCENGNWTMDDGRHHCEGGGHCVGGQKQRENKNSPRDSSVKI